MSAKRITVLGHMLKNGPTISYEYEVVSNLSDSQINKKLEDHNKGKRHYFWTIDSDFDLTNKSEWKRFYHYCIDQYYDHNGVPELSNMGRYMIQTLDDRLKRE